MHKYVIQSYLFSVNEHTHWMLSFLHPAHCAVMMHIWNKCTSKGHKQCSCELSLQSLHHLKTLWMWHREETQLFFLLFLSLHLPVKLWKHKSKTVRGTQQTSCCSIYRWRHHPPVFNQSHKVTEWRAAGEAERKERRKQGPSVSFKQASRFHIQRT